MSEWRQDSAVCERDGTETDAPKTRAANRVVRPAEAETMNRRARRFGPIDAEQAKRRHDRGNAAKSNKAVTAEREPRCWAGQRREMGVRPPRATLPRSPPDRARSRLPIPPMPSSVIAEADREKLCAVAGDGADCRASRNTATELKTRPRRCSRARGELRAHRGAGKERLPPRQFRT